MSVMAGLYAGNVRAVLERGFKVIGNQNWAILISGFFEPVFYLLAMGFGLGGLVGEVTGPDGRPMSYLAFIAPALLATSAMNGAIYDSTWNVFFKMKFARIYEAMLSTSLGPLDVAAGEIAMALFRGSCTRAASSASWWGWGCDLVVGAGDDSGGAADRLGFAAVGMAVTSWFSTFQQMELINIVLLPMFMFSATLFPIDIYPQAVQWFIQAMPLWHGVELMRQLSIGAFGPMTLVHLLYFVVMSVGGVIFCALRLRALFLR